MTKPVNILALETSCDETAAAVIADGRRIVANVVDSQIPLHARFGGVVPEIASRAHVSACDRVIDEALSQAEMTFRDIDALAVTCGPGLVGALLTGVSCMKGLAFALDKPLVAVNHIEGHVSANFLTHPELTPPFLCLIASGGHSHIVNVRDYGEYELLGQTVDDAAGEAFDKAARVLGLPYPGGPALSKLAVGGDERFLKLPHPTPPGRYDFSFSGLKTAFVNACHTAAQRGEHPEPRDLAASFQRAVVDTLAERVMLAARDTGAKKLALAGGVSANVCLRETLSARCRAAGVTLYMPDVKLCTDNAAMIGAAAYYRYLRGEFAPLSLNAQPALALVEAGAD